MLFFTKLVSILLITAITSQAHAGFHFEPYLGKSVSGDWSSSPGEGDVSMTEFGLKMGYQAPVGFQIGGDFQMGKGAHDNILAGGVDADSGHAAFGIYLGYQSDMGLRGYAHYFFASALAFDDANDTAYAGNGFKLGVGYSLLAWLAINLEYQIMNYDEFKNNFVDLMALPSEHEDKMIFITLSFPFNFGG